MDNRFKIGNWRCAQYKILFILYRIKSLVYVLKLGGCVVRLERVDECTLKIFLTFDDLQEQGISVKDITTSDVYAQSIIHEMIEWASEEIGFPLFGAVEMEVYSQQTQGLVILLKTSEEWFPDETIMAVDQAKAVNGRKMIYQFDCFEHVLSLFNIVECKQSALKSSLLYYDTHYYVILEEVSEDQIDDIKAIACEYGERGLLSVFQIEEYGAEIIKGDAIEKINYYFKK